MVSKQVLKRTLIFGLFLLVAGASLIGFRHGYHSRGEALTPIELSLKNLRPKPPVQEVCSDVEHILARLRKPGKVLNKLPPGNRGGALTTDEVVLYKLVLAQWLGKDRHPLTLSRETYPFDVISEPPPCVCMKGFEFESLSLASHSVHTLTPKVLPRNNIRFLEENGAATYSSMSKEEAQRNPISDPEHGVFSLSEIVFDREHRRALVSYSYGCGLLCGSGRTLVFEKVGNEWKLQKLECGGWVS